MGGAGAASTLGATSLDDECRMRRALRRDVGAISLDECFVQRRAPRRGDRGVDVASKLTPSCRNGKDLAFCTLSPNISALGSTRGAPKLILDAWCLPFSVYRAQMPFLF